MPTATFTANLYYVKEGGSSWTAGAARQDKSSSNTRYAGAMQFPISGLNFSNISISEIRMDLVFAKAGAAGTSGKHLTFYQTTGDVVQGVKSSALRGALIGEFIDTGMYNQAKSIAFNASTNAGFFDAFRNYFAAGRQTLMIYVPTSRGTYGDGYGYDYLGISSASITFTYTFLRSDGWLASGSVAAGSAAILHITAYNAAFTHRVTWQFGAYSNAQTVGAGVASAAYTIPLTWLNAIPNAVSGSACVVLETLNGGTSIGSYTYWFTITAPESVTPVYQSIIPERITSKAILNSWGLYAQGLCQVKCTINGAVGAYGSTITAYSITTSPSIGAAAAATMTSGVINISGRIYVTGSVTDSRGRTFSATNSFVVEPYAAPSISAVEAYRSNSAGARDDAAGTYARLRVVFGCSSVGGKNAATGRVTLQQVGGSYSTSSALTSGTAVILGGGSLATDAAYRATITVTDTVGSTSTYAVDIPSAAYMLHFKKGGRALGIGAAAGADGTVTCGWTLNVGAGVSMRTDGEGGNIDIHPPAQYGNYWEADAYNGNLRFINFGADHKVTSIYTFGTNGFLSGMLGGPLRVIGAATIAGIPAAVLSAHQSMPDNSWSMVRIAADYLNAVGILFRTSSLYGGFYGVTYGDRAWCQVSIGDGKAGALVSGYIKLE